MRVLLTVAAISALLHVAVCSGPGTLLVTALAVHKHVKAVKGDKRTSDVRKLKSKTIKSKTVKSKKAKNVDDEIPSVAHNAMTKIKVAKSPAGTTTVKEVTSSVDERERSAVDDKAIAKKQDSFNNGMQMAISVLTMVASRMVFKIDYRNPRTVLLCRLVFCAYVVLSQVLFWFLARQVEKRDDNTLLPQSAAGNPLQAAMSLLGPKLAGAHPAGAMLGSVLSMTGASDGRGAMQTVKQHDLAEVKKLASSMLFELLAATYMHFISKSTSQLLMIPMMGIAGKLKAPIVQIHLLRMRPVGTLQRPFKSGLEAMLGAMSGAQGGVGTGATALGVIERPGSGEGGAGKAGTLKGKGTVADRAKDSDVIDLDAVKTKEKPASSDSPRTRPQSADGGTQRDQVREGHTAQRQGQEGSDAGAESSGGAVQELRRDEEEDGEEEEERAGAAGRYDAAELLEAVDRLGEVAAP